MDKNLKKIVLFKYQVESLMYALYCQIFHSKRKFDKVVGIANGGLHVSRFLSSNLQIPHDEIRISHYDGDSLREKPIIEVREVGFKNCLICDDMIDGGHTLKTFDETYGLKDNAVAVLFWRKASGIKPDFYVAEKPNYWLVMPWEIDE